MVTRTSIQKWRTWPRDARAPARTFEFWEDPKDNGITASTPGRVAKLREAGKISEQAQLLYRIEAGSFEEAMAIHYLRMGWSLSKLGGKASPCPDCGAWIYVSGSGDCWQCGRS